MIYRVVFLMLITGAILGINTQPRYQPVKINTTQEKTKPIPTIDVINSYSTEDKILAELISQQIMLQACSEDKWCEFVPKKNNTKVKKPYFHFSYSNITKLQDLAYEDAVFALKKQSGSGLIKNYKKFLKGDCPRNLSAAFLKKTNQLCEYSMRIK